jgi:hypothetical protein
MPDPPDDDSHENAADDDTAETPDTEAPSAPDATASAETDEGSPDEDTPTTEVTADTTAESTVDDGNDDTADEPAADVFDTDAVAESDDTLGMPTAGTDGEDSPPGPVDGAGSDRDDRVRSDHADSLDWEAWVGEYTPLLFAFIVFFLGVTGWMSLSGWVDYGGWALSIVVGVVYYLSFNVERRIQPEF